MGCRAANAVELAISLKTWREELTALVRVQTIHKLPWKMTVVSPDFGWQSHHCNCGV